MPTSIYEADVTQPRDCAHGFPKEKLCGKCGYNVGCTWNLSDSCSCRAPEDTTEAVIATINEDWDEGPGCAANCHGCCWHGSDPGEHENIARKIQRADRKALAEAGWAVAPVVKLTKYEVDYFDDDQGVLNRTEGADLVRLLQSLGLPIEVVD